MPTSTREEKIEDDNERRRQIYIRCHRLFNTDLGREVLRDLESLFGYNAPDYDHEKGDNILSVKPHENRGMKMPIRHIHTCLASNLNPNRKTDNEVRTKIKSRTQEETGEQEGSSKEGS